MNFQQFATSGFGTRLWLALGRMPTGVGRALARVVTFSLYRRKNSSLYRTLYNNQAHVLGPGANPERVDAAVGALLRHAGMTAFDLVHILAGGQEAILRAMEFPPDFHAHTAAAQATGRGVLVCGGHLSNFNLGFLAFARRGGFRMQVLSAAATEGGFRIMSDLRGRGTLEETPIDGPALRSAIVRLREGGSVAIGVDWPMAVPEGEGIPFFGMPSNLPTGWVRVAMSANAVLLPLGCRWTRERGYYALTRPHLELELTGDRDADIRHNARRVLAVMEGWIAEAPNQWLMYHPVWTAGQ